MHATAASFLPRFLSSAVAGALLIHAAPALPGHIPVGADVDGIRTAMRGEGYLSYPLAVPAGEERTGWTDIRHPALDGTEDRLRGYDWSDFQVVVKTHTVTDPLGATTANAARIRQDFNVANAAYAQAGITVRQEGNVAVNGNNIVENGTGSIEPSLSSLFNVQRSGNANTVNAYYVDGLAGPRGYALPPTYAARGGFEGAGNTSGAIPAGTPVFNNGFAVADTAVNDTWAHELGHFLLDDWRFQPGNNFHSGDANDLMADGGLPRNVPGLGTKAAGDFGLREVGRANGNIGTRSHLTQDVRQIGGAATISQIEAMHKSPAVAHADNHIWAADRADFDWIEDNKALESKGAADNHPGADLMVWGIGLNLPSPHFGHDHGDWGELDLGSYVGPFFRVADVVSQIGRYIDMDVDAAGDWSKRESALDYFLEFSSDGLNWVAGAVATVFKDGWTKKSEAEDYIARWLSPIDARFVRIGALTGDGHDGNTQIDAVIVAIANIPVPGSAALLLAGLVLLGPRRRG